ncbi:MAG: sensor histidine kinase [Saccharospirillum sp.]
MSLPVPQRPLKGLNAYRSLGALLALCLSLLLATGYLYSQTIQRQQDIISTVRENLLWASMQMERETQRWRLFLRDAALSSSYDLDALELRFEILYSRYVTLSQGELRQAIDQDDQLAALLTDIQKQMERLDEQVQAYFSEPDGPYDAFNRGTENLIRLSNDFINQVISLRSDEATVNRRKLLSTMFWLSASVSILIFATMVLIFLLVRGLIKEHKQLATASELAKQLSETAEQAKAASAAKSAFLAMMSHEIRTPLNGILGMLNLLVDEPLAKQPKSYAVAARDSADHLLIIVNDVLDMSSIEAGRMTLINQPMSLPSLLEEIATIARLECKAKPIDFQLHMDALLPAWVESDRIRLRQIILNLVNNAIKFTDTGEIQLSAQWRGDPDTETQGRLRVEVQDSGIGIDAKVQPTLFQEFTQIDNSSIRRFGGTGLGLSICKKLVTLMGGTIGVTSQPGIGSTFWFEVPVRTLKGEQHAENPVIGLLGFDEHDRTVIDEGLSAAGRTAMDVQPGMTLLAQCETVLIDWQPGSQTILDAMAHWQATKTSKPRFVAVVAPELTASAYDFIKAGGQSLMVRPLTPAKIAEQLPQPALPET